MYYLMVYRLRKISTTLWISQLIDFKASANSDCTWRVMADEKVSNILSCSNNFPYCLGSVLPIFLLKFLLFLNVKGRKPRRFAPCTDL